MTIESFKSFLDQTLLVVPGLFFWMTFYSHFKWGPTFFPRCLISANPSEIVARCPRVDPSRSRKDVLQYTCGPNEDLVLGLIPKKKCCTMIFTERYLQLLVNQCLKYVSFHIVFLMIIIYKTIVFHGFPICVLYL